ncbi:MAG: LapA family protein [Cellulomonadaceae bacterium]
MSTQPAPARRNPVLQFLADSWFVILLVALAVVFVVQNGEDATIDLLWLTFRATMWLTFTLVFLAGVVTSWGVSRRRARRARQG